jgi:hypothetical protein
MYLEKNLALAFYFKGEKKIVFKNFEKKLLRKAMLLSYNT